MARSPRDILAENLQRHIEREKTYANHVAKKAGLSANSVGRMLKNAEVSPTLTSITAVADVLRIPAWSLLIDGAPCDPVRIRKLSQLIETYLTLSPDGQAAVERIIELEARHQQR
jgi:hypothetical protein